MIKYLKSPINLLLLFVPATLVMEYVFHVHPGIALFACSGMTLIPLAAILCHSTEDVSDQIGEGLGGLLNATFGNAPELIIGIVALQEGLHDVVKASITGSIIGNVLLVFGFGALFGGMRHPVQRFNQTAASVGGTMLALSVMGFMLPDIFHSVAGPAATPAVVNRMSLTLAVIMLLIYLAGMFFTLKTHRHLYTGGSADHGAEPGPEEAGRPRKSILMPIMMMGFSVVLVALMSEILVKSVEAAGSMLGLNNVFMGVFFLGVLGNAADHSATVFMAMKNKMDAAYNITTGSSVQVALFVAPILLLASYLINPAHPLNFEFSTLELVAIGMGAGGIVLTSHDGDIHWVEGGMLITIYIMLGVAFYFLPGTAV